MIRHSSATGGRIKWPQKKRWSCLLLSTIYFPNFSCKLITAKSHDKGEGEAALYVLALRYITVTYPVLVACVNVSHVL